MLVNVACAQADVPDTSPATEPSLWASEAEAWVAASHEALQEGIPNTLQFLDEEFVFEDRTGGRELRSRDDFIEYAMGTLGPTDPSRSRAQFLSAEGMLDQYYWMTPVPADFLDRVELNGGVIKTVVNSGSVASARMYAPNRRDLTIIEAMADDYVALWNNGGDATAIYARDARIEDTLLGLSLQGIDDITSAVGTGGWPDLPPFRIPDLPWQPEGEGDRELPGGRAIYIAPSDVRPALPDEVRMVLRVDNGFGCPGLMAVSLTWDGEKIQSERRYHEIDSVRRCMDPGLLRTGWWQGIEIPEPIRMEETVPMIWPERDVRVVIYNGSVGMVRFVRWGLERFEASVLPMPKIGSVTFLTNETKCRGLSGFYSAENGGAKITLCHRVADVCEDTLCRTWARGPRTTLLHELAHAWMNEYIDEHTRTSFLRFEGVPRWSDPTDPWEDRGMERAANTIAHWLMHESGSARISDQLACRHVRGGFRIITGIEPLTECP